MSAPQEGDDRDAHQRMSASDEYFVGVDIGTSGCRVSIYGGRGDLASTASADYSLQVPRAGWAEQNPEDIYTSFRDTLASALARFPHPMHRIRAVAFSSVFHSIFPVSAAGAPLHPMLTFADTRAQASVAAIRSQVDEAALYQRTGCPLHPMYPLAKLWWFREHRPDLFGAAPRFISIKEFLVHRLTGRFIVDRSLASGTGLFDGSTDRWDAECLSLSGVDEHQLSRVEATTFAIEDWPAEDFGLPAGVPLVLGAGDGVLSTLGAGAVGPGEYTAMIGTSGAVRICSAARRTDPRTRNWCYNLTDQVWVLGGAITNGGMALRWVRDTFGAAEQALARELNVDPYELLVTDAARKPAGSAGLIFLPFLSGERAPHWNANARGVFFGLTLNHDRGHVVRATLEGILYSMYSVFAALRTLAPDEPSGAVEIRASGSFTRAPAWVQMMADVFGLPITVPSEPEGSAFGAAAMGMLATGHLASPAAIRGLMNPPRQVFTPDHQHHDVYRRLYDVYDQVYRALVPPFDEISQLQTELSRQRQEEP